jgi:hypothetical protein
MLLVWTTEKSLRISGRENVSSLNQILDQGVTCFSLEKVAHLDLYGVCLQISMITPRE